MPAMDGGTLGPCFLFKYLMNSWWLLELKCQKCCILSKWKILVKESSSISPNFSTLSKWKILPTKQLNLPKLVYFIPMIAIYPDERYLLQSSWIYKTIVVYPNEVFVIISPVGFKSTVCVKHGVPLERVKLWVVFEGCWSLTWQVAILAIVCAVCRCTPWTRLL